MSWFAAPARAWAAAAADLLWHLNELGTHTDTHTHTRLKSSTALVWNRRRRLTSRVTCGVVNLCACLHTSHYATHYDLLKEASPCECGGVSAEG